MWNLVSIPINFCSLMKKYIHSNADFMCLNFIWISNEENADKKNYCASPGWMEIS